MGDYKCQRRGYLVVADHQVVARNRVERNPGVTKMTSDDAWLILLVVINAQLNGRLLHLIYRTASATLVGWARFGQLAGAAA